MQIRSLVTEGAAAMTLISCGGGAVAALLSRCRRVRTAVVVAVRPPLCRSRSDLPQGNKPTNGVFGWLLQALRVKF